MINPRFWIVGLLCWQVGTASCQQPPQPMAADTSLPSGESYDPPNSTDTRSKAIAYQLRRTWQPSPGLYLSNELLGGRVERVHLDTTGKVVALIAPENAPINKSAWYAFKLWADEEQPVTLQLTYRDGEHRYRPKLSNDGVTWTPIERGAWIHDKKAGTATLQLTVGRDPLWVAGQELMTSHEVFAWSDALEQRPEVRGDTIGYSTLGKPLRMLTVGNPAAANVLIVFSRQHPPEVTGQVAANAFVEAILDSSGLSQQFLARFRVLVFPLLNPDGVDQGHWRHNAGGVDLNRDWWQFRQPEIRQVTDYLKSALLNDSTRVWYGFDFHSTGSDILYPIDASIIPDETSITRPWIDAMNRALPRRLEWEEEPFDISSPIAKNWIFRTFGAEAVTYELGDETPRADVTLKSQVAAAEMMKLLLQRLAAE